MINFILNNMSRKNKIDKVIASLEEALDEDDKVSARNILIENVESFTS